MPTLMEHQAEVLPKIKNGTILHGGTGSGKGMTAIAYYIANEAARDIYVITTAKKRDSLDWEEEAIQFGISTNPELSKYGTLTVDSWQNIEKYKDVEKAFFIFDEQKAIGAGKWAKMFIKIARKNRWIMLSATPGDTWMDYIPVFVANGFYKNRTHFLDLHAIYAPGRTPWPILKGWANEYKLYLLRNEVLVEMPFIRKTVRHINWVDVSFDLQKAQDVCKKRWNPFTDEPCRDMNEVWRVIRRIVNTDLSRLNMLHRLMQAHNRLIVFYNFDYELELLRDVGCEMDVEMAEYNGHRHDPVPTSENWLYLVNYVAGAEAWNCTQTNAEVYYSLTYSYRNHDQAMGRIDRLDTKFSDLYYYLFMSNSVVDLAIKRALDRKESFNERKFVLSMGNFDAFQDPVRGNERSV